MCCIRRVFRFDAAFACVVCVVRVVAALTCGAQRFLFSVSECARDAPKFDGARASKIFCARRRMCGVGNLGRLRAKIFASGV